MHHHLSGWIIPGILTLFLAFPCMAQTPPTPQPQTQATSPPVLPGPLSSDVTPPPGAATPPVTPSVLPGSSVSSSVGKSFGTAGRGLPGMPGGPPISEAAGARDRSSDYMRPPVVGPLFCDPAINIPCQ